MPKLPSYPKKYDSDSSGDELPLRKSPKKRKRKQNEQVTHSPKKKNIGMAANEKKASNKHAASKSNHTNGNAELSSCASEESVSQSEKNKNPPEMGFLNCEINNKGQTNVTQSRKKKALKAGPCNSSYKKKQVNKEGLSKGVLAFYPQNEKFPKHPASYEVFKASEFREMIRQLQLNKNSADAINNSNKTSLHMSPAKTTPPSVNQNSPDSINLTMLCGGEIEDSSNNISKVAVSFSPSKSTEEHLDNENFNLKGEVEKSTKPICDTNSSPEKSEVSHKQQDSNKYIKNSFQKAKNQNLNENTNIIPVTSIETSPKNPHLNKPESNSKIKQNQRLSKDIVQNSSPELNSKDFISKGKKSDNLLVPVEIETPSTTVSSSNVSNIVKRHKKDRSKGKNITPKNQHSKTRQNDMHKSKETTVVDISFNSPSQSPVRELRTERSTHSEKTNKSSNEKETFHERSALQKNSKKMKIQSLKGSNKKGKSSSNDFSDNDKLNVEAIVSKEDSINLSSEDCVLSPGKSPREGLKVVPKSTECSKPSTSKPIEELLLFPFTDFSELECLDFEDVEDNYNDSPCANSNSAQKITPECPKINGMYEDQFASESINFSALPTKDSGADLNCHLTEDDIFANIADDNHHIELTTSANSNHVNDNGNEFNSAIEHDKVCNRSESNEIHTTIECNVANDIPENNETAATESKEEGNNCESNKFITTSVECDEREDDSKSSSLSTTVESKKETYVCERITNNNTASTRQRRNRFAYYNETDESEQSGIDDHPSYFMPNTTVDKNIHNHGKKRNTLNRYNNSGGQDESSDSGEEEDTKKQDPLFKIPFKVMRKKQPRVVSHPISEHDILNDGELKLYVSQDELEVETDELNKQDKFSAEDPHNFSNEEIYMEVEHRSDSSGEKNTHKSNEDSSYTSKPIEEKNRAKSHSPTRPFSQTSRKQVKTPRLPPIPSLKAYCSSYLKTKSCSQKCCKYLHKVPDCTTPKPIEVITSRSSNAIADPRKVINDFSQVMADIREACEGKQLKRAIDESKFLLDRKSPNNIKDQAVKMLLDAAAELEDESHMFEIFQKILKAYKLLNTKHCSDFIMACKSKPRKTLLVILEMFDFCSEHLKIPLRNDALEVLHDIFCLDRSQWTLTLRLMLYRKEICNQRFNIIELNEALNVCVHCSQTRNDTEPNLQLLSHILEALSGDEFLKLHPETVRLFIILLKQYNFHQNSYRIEKRANRYFGPSPVTFPEHVNQSPFTIIPPVNVSNSVSVLSRILSAVAANDWNNVVQIFRSCIEREDRESLANLQLQFLFKKSAMYQCFASFLAALTSDTYSTHKLTLDEKFIIGQFGITLLHTTYDHHQFAESYGILRLLHKYNINYFELQMSVFANGELSSPVQNKMLGPWDIILVAIDICLRTDALQDALRIVSVFHNKALDGRATPENKKKIIRRRVELLTKLTRMLLKQREGLDCCREALNYLITFLKDGCRNVLWEKNLEDIKNTFNWYFVESLNSKSLDKVEELLGTMTSMGMDLCADINHVIFRGLLVQYYNTGQVKKAEDLYKRCCLYGVYQVALPNILSKSREIILSTEWTFSELRALLDDVLKKFCEMLNPRNKKYSFEEWFSLTLKFVEPKSSNEVSLQVHGIYNTPTSFQGFSSRLKKVLCDIGLVVNEEAMDHFKIGPESVYELCTLWKNNNASKNASSLSEVTAFNWNEGHVDSTFGGKSFSDNKSEPAMLRSSTPKHTEINVGANLSPSPISAPSTEKGSLFNKFKKPYSKRITSVNFASERAKTSGLKIFLNSSGREITSKESIPSKNSSSGNEGETPKCVSPNKSYRASLPEPVYLNEVNEPRVVKDPKYNWVRPNVENNLHSGSYHNQQISLINASASAGRSSDSDEQTLFPNTFTSKRLDDAATGFGKKASDSAFISSKKPFLKTCQFPKSIRWEKNQSPQERKYVCHKHRNPSKNANSSPADAFSIEDSTKSSINNLRDSALILVNQKHKSMSESRREELVTEVLENFLAQYKFTEQQLCQKQTKLKLIDFVNKNL